LQRTSRSITKKMRKTHKRLARSGQRNMPNRWIPVHPECPNHLPAIRICQTVDVGFARVRSWDYRMGIL
jgi:hypothetical protein